MSFPSGATWNWRSGFGTCFKHTTRFRAIAGLLGAADDISTFLRVHRERPNDSGRGIHGAGDRSPDANDRRVRDRDDGAHGGWGKRCGGLWRAPPEGAPPPARGARPPRGDPRWG